MAAAAIAAAIGGGIVLYSLKSSSTPAPDPAPEPTKPEVANDDKVEPTPVSLPPVVVPTGVRIDHTLENRTSPAHPSVSLSPPHPPSSRGFTLTLS